MEDLQRVLAVARGEQEADLVVAGGSVVDVLTGCLRRADVAVVGDVIAAVRSDLPGRTRLDATGRTVGPGLVDAHVHLESAMVTPRQYARAVVPPCTTTVICDPHEIANVAGADGVEWLLRASSGLPLEVLVMAPSCVPATGLATAGAHLDAADLAELGRDPRVIGLGEVMNVPGAVLGDEGVAAKIAAFRGRPVDGHAPTLTGPWLEAYAAAGPASDHETVTADEARAKLEAGLRLFLREGTGAKNLLDLLPAVTAATARRCCLATDDRHPHDLLDEGHLDHLLRLATAAGLDPVTAVQLATLNPAEAFALPRRGALAPGWRADLVVWSDLASFSAESVVSGGRVVARGGEPTDDWPPPHPAGGPPPGRMAVEPATASFDVPGRHGRVRVIGVVPGQLLTEHLRLELPVVAGHVLADPSADVAKLAVLERHHGSGRVGLGFVRGLGLARGAIAGSVAHDHHNLVVAGADDASMRTAAAAVAAAGGGLAAALGQRLLHLLPLPVAGLMSLRPLAEVRAELDRLLAAAYELGSRVTDPFMTLSFLCLEVIPSLKLTDRGLVDVDRFELVPLHTD